MPWSIFALWEALLKNWKAIALLLSALAIGGLFLYVKGLRLERDQALSEKAVLATALENSEKLATARVAALERDKLAAEKRAKIFNREIERIEASREVIDCPVPGMLRDAINGL